MPASSVVCLQVTSGPQQGRKAWIRSGQSLRIGRSEQSDLILDGDPSIAELHLALRFDGHVCRLREVGSSYATLLNGVPVHTATIGMGDCLQIGQTSLRVVAGPARTGVTPEAATADAVLPTFALCDLVQKWVPVAAQWPFARGLSDDVATVRSEALRAAAWSRQPWLIDYCTAACSHPRLAEAIDAAALFAVIADGDRLAAMRQLLQREELGAQRYRLAGIYGHPALLDVLLTAIGSPDLASAAAASAALERITGADLPTVDPPAGAAADDAQLVDPQAAHDFWRSAQHHFSTGTRFSRGIDLSPGRPWQPHQLDLASRADAVLREHYHGRRIASRLEKQRRFTAAQPAPS